jgi:hypothetical protein
MSVLKGETDMNEFYVMYGPGGEVQTVSVAGSEYVALWADMLAALRYKTRHPEFSQYWVVSLDRLLYEEKFLDKDGRGRRFFLMSGADPGLEISRGRVVDPAEIEAALYPATCGGKAPVPYHLVIGEAPSQATSAV